MKIYNIINNYFLNAFSSLVRYLHYSVIVLVGVEILISNFMDLDHNQAISGGAINHFALWSHIVFGLLTLLVSLVFTAIEFKKYGLRYFYPYMYGDFDIIKSDLADILHFKEPKIAPRGLVSSVEGLGLGALLLTVLSGSIWFALWINHYSFADYAKEFHQEVTTLLEIYIAGHGIMGLFHIFKSYI